MQKKVLLIDTVHRIIPDALHEAGYEIIKGFDYTREEILQKISEYYGIVIRSRINIDKEIIDSASNLRFVARVGAGMESIDTDYCKIKGIECLNSPEGNKDAVGEHAVGMLLSLLNNLNKADKEVKSGIWNREDNRGVELNIKTVAIIGYGNMGTCFAKKLSGFDCKIIAYDKYKTGFSNEFVTEVDMQSVYENADILSLHIPLNNETKYLVDKDYLKSFRKNIILINTARGPIVKTKDIVDSLKSGKLISTALDVIEYEESSFETTVSMIENSDFKYLTSCNNVILSPHIAGWTVESKIKLAKVLVEKILNLK